MDPTPRTVDRMRVLRSGRVRWSVVSSCFVLLAAWSIWPAPRHVYSVLPTGASDPATVPMLNAWTIWWNADRLAQGLRGYWDAPIFHPETGTFAFSEPQPAMWAVAPIVWATGTPMPAYQVYLIGMLLLNGLLAVRLLRTLRVRWSVAAAGGVAVLLLPLVHQNREAMQLMALWGVLWTLDALVRHHRNPSWRRGAVLGIAFSSVFMTCVHHGVFLVLLLALTAWMTIPLRQCKRWLVGLAWAAGVALLLLLPLLVPMQQILKQHAFARKVSKVQSLSATASDWCQTVPGALTDIRCVPHSSSRPLSPGWLRIGLAAVGVVLVLRRPRHRRAVLLLAALGLWALLWSFGANLHVAGWKPWSVLSACVPGFSQVRSAYRFAYFAQLAIVLLAAVGLDRLSRCSTVGLRQRLRRWPLLGAFAMTCMLLAFEVPPVPVRLADAPDVSLEPGWVAFVREHTPQGRAIVCLPFAEDRTATGLECTGRWMLYGTRHHVPMVNGYSGFFPKSWNRLVEPLNEAPYSESTLGTLATAGVEFLVIDPEFTQAHGAPPAGSGPFRLAREFCDESGVEVWRLQVSNDSVARP